MVELVDGVHAAIVSTDPFDAVVLEYILLDKLPGDSKMGLDVDKARQAAKDIREALGVIEQSHPAVPPDPLTAEMLAAKLAVVINSCTHRPAD